MKEGGRLIEEKRRTQCEEKLVLPAKGRRAERLSAFPPARPQASTACLYFQFVGTNIMQPWNYCILSYIRRDTMKYA